MSIAPVVAGQGSLGRAAEKTNYTTRSIANDSWRIGSEQSGEDLNCWAGFS